MSVEKIDHVGIAVESIDKLIGFYRDVLGLKAVGSEKWPNRRSVSPFWPLAIVELSCLNLLLLTVPSPDSLRSEVEDCTISV